MNSCAVTGDCTWHTSVKLHQALQSNCAECLRQCVQVLSKRIGEPVDAKVALITSYGALLVFNVEDEEGYVHTITGLLHVSFAEPGLIETLSVRGSPRISPL